MRSVSWSHTVSLEAGYIWTERKTTHTRTHTPLPLSLWMFVLPWSSLQSHRTRHENVQTCDNRSTAPACALGFVSVLRNACSSVCACVCVSSPKCASQVSLAGCFSFLAAIPKVILAPWWSQSFFFSFKKEKKKPSPCRSPRKLHVHPDRFFLPLRSSLP